ncbi:MAG: phosphoribosylformylglycinamidine synthase subunit PurL [Alphaproteobacteria bacterium]|nr:phosphoribosylformylglycinamidine synthase subunit PurL [Alphaproteobacteria bacterium]MBU1513216.1 phosphoribosylformylglycinamidine synthase subunit PurL [Alphaproteobacteria bacterium]MBU2095324.1 phosphoribosylformylglycinamidine synthase subunit PurL [Alphaproteobacteria bacterium]MBU2152239.1 phosphoribosylformylglycinamidine synthase subunit PurL [Alphaproteobacteria bacterium]MBU2306714.1 phosphoribosylformylglycinamidine synthase subunit PurL [Alphaproteobacteria bacterium]
MSAAPAKTMAEKAAEYGLKADEYELIVRRLNREPLDVELGVFSVMWSEHCSYKSSKIHLGKFPTTGPKVICGPGENAGVIDIGDGQACIFKMESHNHPSFIEPYQGAATGVGGIMRDVFTMGARPIALLNALRFGDPSHPKTKRLVSGVVSGIGGYGNCVGVPTVAGETNFHRGYDGNILVNAMCVGLADADKIFYSAAPSPGLPVVYFGSKTGRDGIHGATMASQEFDDASDEKRPTVQVGDPFAEKLLIEATLELMASGAVAAIQDMGAAGLTSSSVEMAGKGGVGIELNLDNVPQREENMSAYEMMLSESQERMLAVLKPGREADGQRIFEKWGLDAATIGYTTDTGHMVLKHKGETVCDVPLAPLFDDAPLYDRPWVAPALQPRLTIADVPEPGDLNAAVLKLMAAPDMASKRWLWEQYDRHVMADTLEDSATGADAGIVRVHGGRKALAVCSDVTPRYVLNDPYEGGKQAVAEAWRNLTAVGASPIAITDNLNFGNPERPEIMGQIVRAIDGMAEACRDLDFPVVSGNVSLYNETNGAAIPPTPTVGGVGLLADYARRADFSSLKVGDVLVLIGATKGEFGASMYLREIGGREDGAPPPVDLALERKTGDVVRALIQGGQLGTVHDLSDGGLAAAIGEMCLASNVGCDLRLEGVPWVTLFAEDQARYLVALNDPTPVLQACRAAGIPATILGEAGGEAIKVEGGLNLPLVQLRTAHEGWMPALMGEPA